MGRICFAILAHNKSDCLRDLVDNLRAFAPDSLSVLFNGGTDPNLGTNLAIPVCPASRPLKWGRFATVHFDVMQWITELGIDYEYMVGLDSDMLLIKHGFEEFLRDEMQGFDYMAVRLRELHAPGSWVTGNRFLLKWRWIWKPLLGLNVPLGCLNAGQVFTRRCVEVILSHPHLSEIRDRAARSSVPCLEEFLCPNLAVSSGCSVRSYPDPQANAIRWRGYHSLNELTAYRDSLPVYLLHPVSMNFNAPDRQFIRSLSTGMNLTESLQELFSDWPPPIPKRTIARRLLSHLRTMWIRLRRE